jgi:hypothetical protein
MQRVGDMECVIILEITGATGTPTKCLQKNVEAIAENHSYIYIRYKIQLCFVQNAQYGEYCRLKLEA